jgi:hypothetical protein
MISLYLATEDVLSEAVADRLVEEEGGWRVAVRLGRRGNGYLRRNLAKFVNISYIFPVFLLTDLDRCQCPPGLINHWRGNLEFPEKMLFRIAVREVEAWLLADREGFARFSGVPLHRIPEEPELLDNPKEALLRLVRRYGKRPVKTDILPPEGRSTARVGPAYNQVLCSFVQQSWSSQRAREVSKSLRRAQGRIHELRLEAERR